MLDGSGRRWSSGALKLSCLSCLLHSPLAFSMPTHAFLDPPMSFVRPLLRLSSAPHRETRLPRSTLAPSTPCRRLPRTAAPSDAPSARVPAAATPRRGSSGGHAAPSMQRWRGGAWLCTRHPATATLGRGQRGQWRRRAALPRPHMGRRTAAAATRAGCGAGRLVTRIGTRALYRSGPTHVSLACFPPPSASSPPWTTAWTPFCMTSHSWLV